MHVCVTWNKLQSYIQHFQDSFCWKCFYFNKITEEFSGLFNNSKVSDCPFSLCSKCMILCSLSCDSPITSPFPHWPVLDWPSRVRQLEEELKLMDQNLKSMTAGEEEVLPRDWCSALTPASLDLSSLSEICVLLCCSSRLFPCADKRIFCKRKRDLN